MLSAAAIADLTKQTAQLKATRYCKQLPKTAAESQLVEK
jgi:hypothetical protein